MYLIKLNSASGESSSQICLLLFVYLLFGKQNIFHTDERKTIPPERDSKIQMVFWDYQILMNKLYQIAIFEFYSQNLGKLSREDLKRSLRFNGKLWQPTLPSWNVPWD